MTRKIIIGVWMSAVLIIIGSMMARHHAPFQINPSVVLAAQSLAENHPTENLDSWLAIHILDPRCKCSENVLAEIVQNQFPNVRQLAVLLSPLSEEKQATLIAAQIPMEQLTPERAEKELHIETVPWLVILNSKFEVLYSGGYGTNKLRQRSDIQLAAIYRDISRGQTKPGFPVYGCVTSENLRKRLLYLNDL